MNEQLLSAIAEELRHKLKGRRFGKIFQLGPLSFAIDFGLKHSYLYFNVEPASPRLYLIERNVKELEKQSLPLSFFGNSLRAKLGHAELIAVEKYYSERVIKLSFSLVDEIGQLHFRNLIAQLTGRAANLFITDELNLILAALRAPKGHGQQLGEQYAAPANRETKSEQLDPLGEYSSVAVDAYFTRLDAQQQFQTKAANARGTIKKSLLQKQKLRTNLEADLARHGDAEAHQKLGNLLLANLTTAVRAGSHTTIVDYYAEGEPRIEIEIDENRSLQDEANRQFRDYTRAKRAAAEIATRLEALKTEVAELENKQRQLEGIIERADLQALEDFTQTKPSANGARRKKEPTTVAGVRRYRSTDGYEIWVGRAARDNDQLTFRYAKPNDLWLHAGDYPGSHVVVRNPNRTEIPHRTVIEAAQLAARFSQASDDLKVVVHYTQRKFLSKPKGSAPGLVRLSTFRSITVTPLESLPRIL